MKKFALLAAIGVAAVSAVHAQDAGGFRIGVKVGGTYSNISGDNVNQITGANYSTDLGDYKLGYNAGIGASIPLTQRWVLLLRPRTALQPQGLRNQPSKQTSGFSSPNVQVGGG